MRGRGDPVGKRKGPAEPEVCVVLVTAPDLETGARIARVLVEEQLIACANLLPGIRSIYRWEGRVADEAEVLLVLKTAANRCGAVAARVKALHPYALPEVVALPVTDGSEAYLDWVLAASGSPRADRAEPKAGEDHEVGQRRPSGDG
jgi:periplasmic divalent cation tolerance protein